MNTDGTGFHTCKECHKTESLWNHSTSDHREGEQLEDRRSVGASSCNSGDGTDQRVQSLMFIMIIMYVGITSHRRSQWPRGPRRRSAAARLLRLWVRIPPGAWMFVCCECRVLSAGGFCDGLITRTEESHRRWCVVLYYLETSWMRTPWSTGDCCVKKKKFASSVCT